MYCLECGNQNPDHAKFCFQCGYNFSKISSASVKTLSGAKVIGLTVLTLVLIAGVGFGVLMIYQQEQKKQSPLASINTNVNQESTNTPIQQRSLYPAQEPPPPPQIKAGNQQVVQQAFTVEPGAFRYFKVDIPSSLRNTTLSGRFSASGGQGNDIQVLVTDEDGLTNIKNGHSGRVWYDSGKVTVGDINVRLSPGTYYIIFNNRFSVFSNKAVSADIHLRYEYY